MKPIQKLQIPKTEGIKYAGSKLRLLPQILALASKTGAKSVLDGFSGTTRVSQAFAQIGYRVVSNDAAVWSKVFATCYLKNTRPKKYYAGLIDHLNDLPGKEGWFTENYGGSPDDRSSARGDGLKKPFQIHNTKKLDAIRDEIEKLTNDETEKSVLLTSLILALDKVDSTLGHHASYLKNWSPRSYKTLNLEVPRIFHSEKDHEVRHGDIFQTVGNVKTDLAYFDPPYGSNNEKMPPSRVRYAAYYHLWTSIVLGDKPETFGKAKRRTDTRDHTAASVFEEFRTDKRGDYIAVEALRKLIKQTNAAHILLSYSSGGRATAANLFDILEESGKITDLIKMDYRRNIMASMCWTNDWIKQTEEPNIEFLFLIEK
ncbi:MAG: DNA adenine methylase [Pyrinomonadaceae bacterium]